MGGVRNGVMKERKGEDLNSSMAVMWGLLTMQLVKEKPLDMWSGSSLLAT